MQPALLAASLFATSAQAHHGSADAEVPGSILGAAIAFAGLALLVGAIVAVVIRLMMKER